MASGGAVLKFKFVRLWVGLEQGLGREVSLHCHGPAAGQFELRTESNLAHFPVTSRDLRSLFEGASVKLATAGLTGNITPHNGEIRFNFEPSDISFALARDHLALLVHSLGFDGLPASLDLPQRL